MSWKIANNYSKQLFDENRNQISLNVGDMGYVENGNKLNRKKLDELKTGPFQIMVNRMQYIESIPDIGC